MNRRSFLNLGLIPALGSVGAWTHARAADRIGVVASFSILGDMVRQVGGERVEVRTLIGPDGDAHVYQPTPADAKSLAEASVFVINGLGYEGWVPRLQKSSGFKGRLVTASDGVAALEVAPEHGHDHGHAHGKGRKIADPHAWQSLSNGKLYVRSIRDGLIKADEAGRAAYEAQAASYLTALDALDAEVKGVIAGIPADRRKVITTHEAFGYFAAAYGLTIVAPEGVSTENAASAKDVARIIRQIRSEKVAAVFVENISDTRLLDQISRETGARIGGTLYSDALSPPTGPAATYVEMVRHNVRTIAAALAP